MLGERVEGDEEGPITMERLGQHKSLVGPRTIKLKSGEAQHILPMSGWQVRVC
jgi:hypothetical protein